jgi:dienelactone hydrolase
MRFPIRRLSLLAGLLVAFGALGGDTVRPGLEGLDYAYPGDMTKAEAKLVDALGKPLIEGMDCEAALQAWFDGRLADVKKKPEEAKADWERGLTLVKDLKPLPKAKWDPVPDATFKLLGRFRHPQITNAELWIVMWTVDDLKQYGVLVTPANRAPDQKFPLMLYVHGAAYGVPVYSLPWLARMAAEGYVIVGPALRGEDLFASRSVPQELAFRCEGEIENLDGEVDDALSAVSAAQKLPFVKKGEFAVIGHSFGAGVGLLAAARHPKACCVISYDAWLVNPFRFYWDRMRRGANNWLSWADFCNQPVKKQLAGLMKRSIVHNADKIHCPVLMFIGGARLKKAKKPYIYDVVPGGGHNFVLYEEDKPAKYAFAKHMEFLRKYLPPVKPAGKAKKAIRPPVPPAPPAPPAPPTAPDPAEAREPK